MPWCIILDTEQIYRLRFKLPKAAARAVGTQGVPGNWCASHLERSLVHD